MTHSKTGMQKLISSYRVGTTKEEKLLATSILAHEAMGLWEEVQRLTKENKLLRQEIHILIRKGLKKK